MLLLRLRPAPELKAIKHTNPDAKPDNCFVEQSTKAPEQSTEEREFIKWATSITDDMDMAKFLNNLGWTTLDQMRKFTVDDIPDDLPKRFHTRLMKAVRALLNESTEGEASESTEKKHKPAVIVVHVHHRVVPVYIKEHDIYGYIDVHKMLDPYSFLRRKPRYF